MKKPNKSNKPKELHTQQISSNARKNGLGKHATSDSQYQGFRSEMSIVSDNSTPILMEGIRGKVFMDRYALRAKDGTHIETTPEEMWKRGAWGISQAEKPAIRQEWEQKFYDVMKGFKFVPGGRILSGAGTGYQVTYFNCFVIPSPQDSRDGIIDALKQLVEIQSRSGGVGLNLSSLRPKGARVKKVNGFSSGPVTWAGLFSYATHDVVQQGGSRRGATMLMLHDWHPDVEEFITVKQDLSKINGANLSVCVSDGFMEAVKKDADWDLVYPDLDDPHYDEKWDGELDSWKAQGGTVKVYKTVKAKYLWDLICEAAWRSAEPGLHFLERSNARSNTWYFERLVATNPSLRAGTKVLTKEGIFPIESLDKKRFYVKNLNGEWSLAECFLSGKNKTLYKVSLNNGREIYATAEHKWPTLSVGGGFGKVTTDNLQIGNILPFPKVEHIQFESVTKRSRAQGFMLGWLYGDGWITQRGKSMLSSITHVDRRAASSSPVYMTAGEGLLINGLDNQPMSHQAISSNQLEKQLPLNDLSFGFLFSEEDKPLADAVLQEVNKLKKEKSTLTRAGDNTYTIQSTSSLFAENLFNLFDINKKENGIPSSVWQSGTEFIEGFIDGLFSSDGFVSKDARRVVFTTKHKKMAEDVQDLLSFFGIKARIRREEASNVRFPNGKNYYKTYERYDVSMDGYNAVNFGRMFTLSHNRKQQNLLKIVSEYNPSRKEADAGLVRITAVEKTVLQEDVWDISVYDQTHCFYINGCITGNCGEQPLGPWAVCNLGAMNLSAYVTENHSPDGEARFDFESFGQDVKVAMRLMDNVIDQTYYFFPENEDCAKNIRRTGLGIMGLADALIKMKLRYGSPESEPVIRQIFQTLRDSAYEASADNAKEKGSFPLFDKEKYLQGYHIKQLPEPIRAKIATQGIRNAVLLTIAPTGTTSLVSGVSSGVEPVYEFSFLRRWRGGEEIIYHPLFDQWRKDNPGSQKPDYFVSANDLTPWEHVKVQAIAQEYIDSSISKTVNAPNNHTVDDVQSLYMAAYDVGLKGITYMRDGSRQGVLERVESPSIKAAEDKEKKVEPVVPAPVHRPMVLRGRTYKVTTPLGEGFITINRDDKDQPFEVFITVAKGGSHTMADAEALGRLISMTLRYSGDNRREIATKIVQQLRGIGGSSHIGFGKDRVMSLADAIAKVLAEDMAITEAEKPEQVPLSLQESHSEPILHTNGLGTHKTEVDPVIVPEIAEQMPMLTLSPRETQSGDLCPECGNSTFVMEEGCQKCYSCGYSKC